MAQVTLENLEKSFGNVKAVDGVNLKIKDKEFVSLLGPSGCGKTTTLRMIAGLEDPTSGDIFIDDQRVNDLPPKDRNLAMVFQSYALYPHMSAFDNIAFPLKLRKLSKTDIEKRVNEVGTLLGIKNLLSRKPKELSGGERQRVALGRAIVRKPKVFLLDEPLSNLDAKLRIYMRTELKRLQKDLEVTTIYVTHDQIEALTMSDKIAVMNEGKLLQLATADSLYNQPVTSWVGNFIGSPPMNLIECSFKIENGIAVLDAGEFKYKINKSLSELIEKNSKSNNVILGIRPEDIKIHLKNPPKDAIKLKVYEIEPIGDSVIVDIQNQGNIIKSRVPRSQSKSGDSVNIHLDPERIHVYDKKTDKIIF